MKTHRSTALTNITNTRSQNDKQPNAPKAVKDPQIKAATQTTMASQKKAAHIPKDAVIIVKFDAKWGNNLFVHGEGAGLAWENGKGSPMTNISEDCWVWIPPTKGKHEAISFKITINNGQFWVKGENIQLKAGEKITLKQPEFDQLSRP